VAPRASRAAECQSLARGAAAGRLRRIARKPTTRNVGDGGIGGYRKPPQQLDAAGEWRAITVAGGPERAAPASSAHRAHEPGLRRRSAGAARPPCELDPRGGHQSYGTFTAPSLKARMRARTPGSVAPRVRKRSRSSSQNVSTWRSSSFRAARVLEREVSPRPRNGGIAQPLSRAARRPPLVRAAARSRSRCGNCSTSLRRTRSRSTVISRFTPRGVADDRLVGVVG
jgi:hypothetical protein